MQFKIFFSQLITQTTVKKLVQTVIFKDFLYFCVCHLVVFTIFTSLRYGKFWYFYNLIFQNKCDKMMLFVKNTIFYHFIIKIRRNKLWKRMLKYFLHD